MTNKTINNLKAAFTFIKVDKKPLKHLLYVVLCSLISFNTSGLPSKFRLVGIGDLSTEMTLVFDTSFDGDFENKNPKVYYATKYNEVSELTSAFLEPASTNTSFGMVNNICRFTNLEPNTIYYFKVVDDDGSSAIYHFETLPNDDTPLSIIAGGNSRNGRSTRRNANIVAGRLKPHAIILSGPFTDNSNSEEWQDWFEDWQHSFGTSNRIAPIIPARSNHENNNIDLMELLGTPDKMYYTSTNNSLLSVITLQGGMTFSYLEEQTAWLLNTLAHTNTTYKIVQYHGTMRSHFGGGIDRNGEYYHWAKMFEDYQIDLVVETHRPLSKTTWPISVCVGGLLCEEGFKRDDENGVVYTGDGAWGAPRRPSDDNKSWTHSSDMLNNFKWIFIFPEKMELRTVSFENSLGVSELDINNRFQIPGAIDIYGDVTIINAPNNLPAITNKPQDNETYVNIQPITLSAAIENSDFSIDKIDFYINDSLVFTGIHAPYEYEDWLVPDYGIYSLTTITTFSNGETKKIDSHFQIIEPIQTGQTRIANALDDAEQLSDGKMDLTNRDMDLGYNGTTCGFRFQNGNLPSNAFVTEAYIQFTVDERKLEPTELIIYGERNSNAKTFYIDNNNISNRTKTTNSTSWIPEQWIVAGDSGIAEQTPDLSNILNEIIATDGYDIKSPFVFLIEGSGYRVAETVDSDSTSAPVLHYSYYMGVDVSPGDADNNGKVTGKDVLYISLSYNNAGPTRLNATTDWIPQPVMYWNSIVNGVNLAHQDADGDGLININDINVVDLNYDKQTSWYMPKTVDPTKVLELEPTSPIGQTTEYGLFLKADNQVTAHGIHGSIDLSDFLKTPKDSVKVDPAFESILGEDVVFTKFHEDTKILDFAISRTDGQDKPINDSSLLRVVIVMEDIVEGGEGNKAVINSSGLVFSDGLYQDIKGSTFNLYKWRNQSFRQLSVSDLNFSITTTKTTCEQNGTAEVQLYDDNQDDLYNFYWSNGKSGKKINDLATGNYALTIEKNGHHLTNVDFEIMHFIDEIVLVQESVTFSTTIKAFNEISFSNGVEIPKNHTVEFLIESCK